jgi:3-dehydroquinate dehydratase type I
LRDFPCDIVEARLDKIGAAPHWLESCEAIEERGEPVLLTVRSAKEGGAWRGSDDELRRVLLTALHRLAAVDIELACPIAAEIAAEAARLGKGCVLSHHDFARTPSIDELESIITRAEALGGVTKIATMVNGEDDRSRLLELLGTSHARRQPLCVIGMGEKWAMLRVELARLGSCLAYGYLDNSAAPGQLAAAEVVDLLRV